MAYKSEEWYDKHPMVARPTAEQRAAEAKQFKPTTANANSIMATTNADIKTKTAVPNKLQPKGLGSGGASNKLIIKQTPKTPPEVKYSDSRPVPQDTKFTGYIQGYEKVTVTEKKRLAAGLEIDNREIGNHTYLPSEPMPIQTSSDYDTDNFKYEIRFKDDPEDPTFLGFEVYIDDMYESSPFFGVATKNKVLDFLTKYKTIPEIEKRIDLFKEFQLMLFDIFNSTTADGSQKKSSKNYYILSIKGTDAVVNKKLINYPEDKITITLNEDVCMTAQYLAELYNNLIYSYKSNRYMIPEHLLRFDMHIKVNDMRKFRSGFNFSSSSNIDVDNIPRSLEQRNSYIVYTLHDCNFDFFNSKNSPDEIVVGGYGAGANSTPATMSFDVRFKSVSKRIEPILKSDAYIIHNKESVLRTLASEEVDSIFFKMVKTDDDLNKFNEQDLYKYVNQPEYGASTLDKTSAIKKKKGYEKYLDTAKGALKHVANETKDSIVRNLKNKRDELINRFVSQVMDKATINKLTDMGNVYQGDFRQSTSLGSNIKNDIIRNLNGDIKSGITKGKSAMTSYIANFDKKIGF